MGQQTGLLNQQPPASTGQNQASTTRATDVDSSQDMHRATSESPGPGPRGSSPATWAGGLP
eukprot:8872100-Lingulodinium_polyedra.AAC.1